MTKRVSWKLDLQVFLTILECTKHLHFLHANVFTFDSLTACKLLFLSTLVLAPELHYLSCQVQNYGVSGIEVLAARTESVITRNTSNIGPAASGNLRRNMKNLLTLSALAAVLAVSATYASAETIQSW